MSRRKLEAVLASALVVAPLAAPLVARPSWVHAGDGVAAVDSDDPPRPKRAVKHLVLEEEDAVKRAYAKARDVDDPKITRFDVVHQSDDVGQGVLSVVEFENGDMGLYWGCKRDENRDQWIYVAKGHLQQIREAIGRQVGVTELR